VLVAAVLRVPFLLLLPLHKILFIQVVSELAYIVIRIVMVVIVIDVNASGSGEASSRS
jgi:hypothetical protein